MRVGAAFRIAVCAAGLSLLLGCAAELPAQDPSALQGKRWVATKVATGASLAPVVGEVEMTAEFAESRVAGSGGVNSYSGAYTTSQPDKMEIGPINSTLIAGPPTLMEQEAAYFKALDSAVSYRVSAASLELADKDGNTLVSFVETRAVPLVGTTWYCTGYNNGKQAVVSVATGSEITAEFASSGTLAGSSGVNAYNTTYTSTAPASLTIADDFTMTSVEGSGELMAQEAAYLAALPSANYYRVDGTKLELREGANGPMVATFTSIRPQ